MIRFLFVFLAVVLIAPNFLVGQVDNEDNRAPIPSVDLQIKYRDEIKNLVDFDLEDNQAPEKLVKLGRSTDEIAKKYVLYRVGLNSALDKCDPDTALFAIDRLNSDFQVDFWKFVLDSTDSLRKSAKDTEKKLAVRRVIDDVANQAVLAEKFKVAETLVGRAVILSSALGDDMGQKERSDQKKQIGVLLSFVENFAKAQETLLTTPDDSNAIVALGHYQIFVKGNFEKGLQQWGKSKSSKYRKLAAMEFETDKTNPAQTFDLAGKWLDLGNKNFGIREKRFKEHARLLYESCQAELTGDSKTAADQKLGELAKFFNTSTTSQPEPPSKGQLEPPPLPPPTLDSVPKAKPVKFPPETQLAIDAGLQWIANHQLPDGGWSFQHTQGPGDFRKTSGEATRAARNGATAVAILTFLQAGSTHKTGKYKKQVEGGLSYLMSAAKKSGRGISFLDPSGTMYSHALVSRAICEAYGASGDRRLASLAQGTIWYIEDSQDPVGGGWRYRPREPGDTSVLGWQMSALESAKSYKLTVNPRTYLGANKFLDTVDSADGVYFGYMAPPRTMTRPDARSVIGMLGRIQIGMEKSDPKFQALVKKVLDRKVDAKLKDVYYHYYATKLMKVQGGGDWLKWKNDITKVALRFQGQDGFEKGSWWLNEKTHAGEAMGRFGATAFALWCLME